MNSSISIHANIHTLMMTSYWIGTTAGQSERREAAVQHHRPSDQHQQKRWMKCLAQGHNNRDARGGGSNQRPTDYKTDFYLRRHHIRLIHIYMLLWMDLTVRSDGIQLNFDQILFHIKKYEVNLFVSIPAPADENHPEAQSCHSGVPCMSIKVTSIFYSNFYSHGIQRGGVFLNTLVLIRVCVRK